MTDEPLPPELVIGGLLDGWGARAGLRAHSGGPESLRTWSDSETEFVLFRDGGQFAVENRDRGELRTWARFGSASEAETFLLGKFVSAWVAGAVGAGRMPSGLAEGASIEAGSGGYRLIDTGGRMSLFRRRSEAETYWKLAALTPAQIAALPQSTG